MVYDFDKIVENIVNIWLTHTTCLISLKRDYPAIPRP